MVIGSPETLSQRLLSFANVPFYRIGRRVKHATAQATAQQPLTHNLRLILFTTPGLISCIVSLHPVS
jgi:hypothetical protein